MIREGDDWRIRMLTYERKPQHRCDTNLSDGAE